MKYFWNTFAALICLVIFCPWLIGLVDLGAWGLTGQTVTSIPWGEDGRTGVLVFWPITTGFLVGLVASVLD